MHRTATVFRTQDIFKLALPMMASFLLEMLIGLTDAAFLGRTTPESLGAAAVSGVLFMTVSMIGTGYSTGLQAAMARANGQGRDDETGRLFRSGTCTLMILAAAGIAFCTLAGPWLFSLWLEHPGVEKNASDYLHWRGLGLPAAFLCAAFRAYFVAVLRPNVLTTSAVAMIATNALLNYILIFGMGPVPSLGISGAAIASAASELAALLVFLHEARRQPRARTMLQGSWDWDPRTQKTLFVLGRWVMLQEGAAFCAWFYFFLAIEHLGAEELALSNVLRQIGSLLFLFIHALGSTSGAICANLLGERREQEIPGVFRRGLLLCAVLTAASVLLLVPAPRVVLGLLTDLPEVRGADLAPYWVLLASFLPGVPGMYVQYVLAGIGRTKAAATASLVSVIVYVAYIAWLTEREASLAVYWCADAVYYAAAGLVAWILYQSSPWNSSKNR